ncbi:hypothetical protein [Microbacterium candidum]|uniref:Uncharacterized protein n=1 Tax=Microbacterium candidum TaxID=3041922 RepID=A0ABT7MX23_9MICO|nr:hypothetical protein [Microbacterium sp. ASV49]MDL9978992.1 hypothetical protein [Microbacterium sp. ASV49]
MMPRVTLVGAGILLAAALVAVAPAARAATVTTVVQGSVIRLVSTLDPTAATTMLPGVPVDWDIEVSASLADGVIDVALGGTATPDAFALTARECATAWTDTGCATGERMLGTAVAGEPLPLGRQSSAAQRWYRIEVVLARWVPGATATLEFRASGVGATAPAGTLPATGGGIAPLFVPALVAIGSGLLIAGIARAARGPAAHHARGRSG